MKQVGKVVIVTGANTGIGRETARGLLAEGATVVLAVRNLEKGEEARADIVASTGHADAEVMELDLASTASIRAFAAAFKARFDRLDVLVHNAGIWTRSRTQTVDGFETTFGVNHLGPFLLTHELRDLLVRSAPARVVVVSSALHYRGAIEWEDPMFERKPYGATRAYNQSKLANVLFAKALSRRLSGTGVTVHALHPGVVATELTRELPGFVKAIAGLFMLTPAQGAATSLHVALSDEGGKLSGEYWEKSRPKTPSRAARDEAAQERLWKLSERLLNLEASYDDAADAA
jgi:NAD(P)-dependent dehydrogenase (short-subunit alcohol dehydrogenase family)